MLTTKKRTGYIPTLAVVAVAATLLTACGPPGSRDLRRGQRQINAGEYEAAISTLNDATHDVADAPPGVQSKAWNLLGMAYHHAGQLDAASQAYLQARKLDHNHEAVDYNLGCLRMEQGNYPGAIDYFTTCVTLKPGEPEGYLKLGAARFHLALEKTGAEKTRQMEAARHDFETAEKVRPTAEGANAIGMLELQHRNASIETIRIAAADFQIALNRDTNYGPALLNLGILDHQYLNQLPKALQLYRQYIFLTPAPPHVKEVAKLVHDLDTETRITIGADSGDHAAPGNRNIIMGPKSSAPNGQKGATGEPPTSKATRPSGVPEENSEIQIVNVPAQAPTPPAAQPPTPPPKTASSSAPSASPAASSSAPSVTSPNQLAAQEPVAPPPGTPPRKTFTQKLNPAHWFSAKTKTSSDAAVQKIKRYQYPAPTTPIPGNRQDAENWAAQGAQAGQKGHLQEAVRDYQQATAKDPTDFDAALALGLTAIDAGAYETALEALYRALALDEDSANGRYAFAWTLQKRGYYIDAAAELEKLLTAHPDEARGHLLLGNLDAEKLGLPKEARQHYARVLELDPNTPQASAIRAWISKTL